MPEKTGILTISKSKKLNTIDESTGRTVKVKNIIVNGASRMQYDAFLPFIRPYGRFTVVFLAKTNSPPLTVLLYFAVNFVVCNFAPFNKSVFLVGVAVNNRPICLIHCS